MGIDSSRLRACGAVLLSSVIIAACGGGAGGNDSGSTGNAGSTGDPANTGLTPLAPWPGVADWSTYQGTAAHTGYVPVTIDPQRIGKRWTWNSPNPPSIGFRMGPPVQAGGLLFASVGNTVWALKETDASAVWSYDVTSISGGNADGAQDPAVDSGHVWFAGGHWDTTYMFSLDATTGAVKTKSPLGSQYEDYYAPVIVDGDVYTEGGAYGGLSAFDADGNHLFQAQMPQADQWSPAADADYIYTYATGNVAGEAELRQIDRRTGDVVKTILDDASSDSRAARTPILTPSGGVVAFGSGNVTRFDIAAGTISWQLPGGVRAYAKGVVYAIVEPQRIDAHDERTGALLWSWPLPTNDSIVGDIVVTDNLLFVSTYSQVYAVDLAKHAVVWNAPLSGNLSISSSGLLYVSSRYSGPAPTGGWIVAFNLR